MQKFSFDQAYLFNTGSDFMSYNLLGSHSIKIDGTDGYSFSVWAPTAKSVCVVGDFNYWDNSANILEKMGDTGIFYGFVLHASQWQRYKFGITSNSGSFFLKADPYAIHSETRNSTSSILYPHDDGFVWSDKKFIDIRVSRGIKPTFDDKPLNIYEVHLGSWKRYPDDSFYDYRKIAHELCEYVSDMGYTHIELLPVMEHPLDDSWGYQVTGFYSPTSRFGTPCDFKYFVDYMHNNGIGVILDWVPGHFPKDAFGLARFDGSAVYEYADDRVGEHKEWGTYVFNYSRAEVRSFLMSNAMYWAKEYHIDGIRVDAVSSMLYLNYGRTNYIRNIHGGVENLEAVSFLQQLNDVVLNNNPGFMMIAEESTAWAKVTASQNDGGLGFTHKWNMGWMHDTLDYFSKDYIYRKWHQSQISFSLVYAFSESFILPMSHDEIVHGKGSLINKMPGDEWRKFASLRTLYAYMIAHPGGKLIFMGSEFGQFIEWRFYEQLEWFMLANDMHKKLQNYVKELNHIYLSSKELWEQNGGWDGFSWHSADDSNNSIFIFSRHSKDCKSVIVVLNMSPNAIEKYKFGVSNEGHYKIILNSDDIEFGGSDYVSEIMKTNIYDSFKEINDGGFPYSLEIPVPPLAALYIKYTEIENY